MDAQVTDDMVTAAQHELPGVWNRERVRRALVAGLAAMPEPGPGVAANTPHLNPVLDRPLELGTLATAARRLGVARSTATGWVHKRAENGMPEPVDGEIYDLVALEAWYRQWKGN